MKYKKSSVCRSYFFFNFSVISFQIFPNKIPTSPSSLQIELSDLSRIVSLSAAPIGRLSSAFVDYVND